MIELLLLKNWNKKTYEHFKNNIYQSIILFTKYYLNPTNFLFIIFYQSTANKSNNQFIIKSITNKHHYHICLPFQAIISPISTLSLNYLYYIYSNNHIYLLSNEMNSNFG